MSRQAGFTLLEVMVAVFVFAITMGALLMLLQQNLARLGRARLETQAGNLAEDKIREIAELAKGEDFPENDEGAFDPPDDMLRWVASIETYGIELAEEDQERAGSSSVFAEYGVSPGAPEPSLHRVTVRIFPEDEEQELIEPFVTFVVRPFEPTDEEDAP